MPKVQIIVKDEATYCLYCKQKLLVDLEIEKGFHTSCHESILEEKNLSINQIIERFYVLTNGSFKLINLDDELEEISEIDFDFIDHLEPNRLYIRKKPHTSFEYFSLQNINSLPFELTYFSDLKVLKIVNNFSMVLNDYLGFLTNLSALYLGFNDFISGIQYISELKNLVYLRLAGPIAENFLFPDSFVNLKNLKVLELESFDSKNLIKTIENMDHLKRLNLSIGIINEPLVKLDNLEEAKFSNVKFTTNFAQIIQSPNLKYLSFSNCPFNQFPDSFSANIPLENLSITNCLITELPPSLSSLNRLKSLILKSTKISVIPNNLVNLTTLQIDSSPISEIDSRIGNMKKLKSLSVTNSPIRSINKNISKLQNLRVLNVSGTETTSFPDEMEKLFSLEVLNISNNGLKTIPEVVCKLRNLKILILDNNIQLTEFSNSLRELNKLEILSLRLIPLPEITKKKLENLLSENKNIQIVYY